jgi:hypothetical protein
MTDAGNVKKKIKTPVADIVHCLNQHFISRLFIKGSGTEINQRQFLQM